MRYKDLLIVIGLVTLVCWIWAEPAPDVAPVPREPFFLSQEPVSPTVVPSPAPASASKPPTGSSFLNPTPLQISVIAGEDFDSTVFLVSIPEEVRSLVHPRGESRPFFESDSDSQLETVRFEVALRDLEVTLKTSSLAQSKPWTWRFTGADLSLSGRSPVKEWDRQLKGSTRVYVSTSLFSKVPVRYVTRGANLHFFGGPMVELEWK